MTSPLAPLLGEIRSRFAHVETCPFTGPRVFFENAGGALTLNSVVETSAKFAAIPDNQGRANEAAAALGEIIAKAKSDAKTLLGTEAGQIFVGESGTELLFRLIRTACLNTPKGSVIGSTVEHPASRSAARKWADHAGHEYVAVPHDDALGTVSPEAYADQLRADTRVATILHTSPVTGMTNDVVGIAKAIRAKAPEAFIIVDGIQHASHGAIDVTAMEIDGYVISPYKVFSRHGYGIAWASDRLSQCALEALLNGPAENWELGTRDTGAYATFSDVVAYFEWLGAQVSSAETPRARIEAAGRAIHAHEAQLTNAMLFGTGNLPGLAELPGIQIIGGPENPARAGLVCFAHDKLSAAEIVDLLNAQGVRTHTRKADHYSGNVLDPLGLNAAVRVSTCHYNSEAEVAAFLAAMKDMV